MNRICFFSKGALKSNVILSGCRHPGTNQIKDGMKTNCSCLAITATSTLSFNLRLISKAAVSPAKLPPKTTTDGIFFFLVIAFDEIVSASIVEYGGGNDGYDVL